MLSLSASCVLLVAAAADLAPLQRSLQAALPGCAVKISFGSSGMLARQIEAGAGFDLYLAANREFVDDLVRKGLVEKAVPYATGRLGVWSKRGLRWGDIPSAARVSIANPAHAPYGIAAREALESQGLWLKLKDRLVYGENVRQAWQFAETGNADLTITAWSLMHDRGGELVPEAWHRPIVQAGGVTKRSANAPAARRLLAWLTSAAGQSALKQVGFGPAPRTK
jgi:molybdate transport system substrate-binding protein